MKGPRIVVPRFVFLVVFTSLLAGLTYAVLAPAQTQRPDHRLQLLLVQTDARGTAMLARSDARVLARYESFAIVEAQGRDATQLLNAGAERRDDMLSVETAAGEVDPSADRASLADKDAPDRDEALVLVQFVGPPKDAWVERLAATGARVVTYQAENAYIVHARGGQVDRVAALQGGHPAVRSVSVMTASDKLEDRSSPTGVFAVTTVDGSPGADARGAAAQAGPPAGAAPVIVGHLRTDYRELSSSEVARLAREPGVVAVEAYADPQLLDERAAQIVAGNLNGSFAPTAPTYEEWLTSMGFSTATFDFAIDVTDEGLDNGSTATAHRDFRALGVPGGATRVSYVTDYTGDPDGRDCGGHGTNVASIAAGYNTTSSAPEWEDPANYNHGLGVAPFARIGASKIFDCDGTSPTTWTPESLTAAAYAGGARISNNSWGGKNVLTFGDYSAISASYDRLVRDARPGGGSDAGNQEMIEVFAAGNSGDDVGGTPPSPNEGYGTISSEGSAKNVITVGASESVRQSGTDGCGVGNAGANSARDIIDFSSRGPTDDGRLKPDLVAPGTHVTGAAPQHPGYDDAEVCDRFFTGTTWYSLVSGTSQATPQVSGAAALLRDWYRRTEVGEPAPSPALTKALLVNTATDLAGGVNGKGDTIAAGPNSDQGWGRVNVGNAFDSTAREYRDQLPADLLSTSGDSRVRAYSVVDASRPVKVTLAWTDAPGPTTGNPVVNNLDLVVDAGGRTYKGNVFAGAWSRTGGTADPRNNLESVYLPAGAVTRLGVTVKATSIAGNGVPSVGDNTDQDFALVVSNADELAPTPILSGEAPELSDAGPGGDEDGTLEPGESFGLDQDIRNGGDGPATGITGTMSGAAPVTFTQPTSGYPDTAPGVSSAAGARFAGTLSAAATCGADVTATLSLDTDQGTQDVPVVLPTGFPGSPTPASAANPQVPRAIPDDSSAGVTSTLTIANHGTIKDLDVTISRITHPWVGDVTIELSHPDGTTVKLAENPGGLDNGGKNFVDTVFDDEAPLNILSGNAPYTGSFRPQNDELSRFDGKNKLGTWTLRVRDLFEGDTGTLEGWGTSTRTATCARNPQTTITNGPAEDEFVESTSATFEFTATELPGTPPFECRLDGGTWDECNGAGRHDFAGLSQGQHTFEVRAIDAQSDADPTPATRTWAVDTVGPAVDIDQPMTQETVTDPTPTFSGSAGTAFGDVPEVKVRILNEQGGVVQEMTRTPAGSTWSATAAQLADGNYTVEVEQRDEVDHLGTDSAEFTLQGDFEAPAVSITAPANGSATTDTSPAITGIGGTEPGDQASVSVEIRQGSTVVHAMTPSVGAGGAWATEPPQPLPLGSYTVRASQSDNVPNTRSVEVAFSVVDTAAPTVSISSPPNGSTTADSTPALSGGAGTAPGDASTVTVLIRRSGGGVVQSLSAPVSGGAWSATASTLADGTYTAQAEQSDASGNVGRSAVTSFTVDTSDQPEPPSFLLAPAEERMADALAGRLTVVAACEGACQVSARLTVSARASRSLGLGRNSTALGSGRKRLTRAGTAAATVRLTKKARAALRRESSAKATLRVKLTGDGGTLSLSRTISLQRSAGLRRIASRGLKLWALCSETCPLAGKLTMAPSAARRIGLNPKGSARMQVAFGRTTAAANTPTRLTLKVRRGARTALRKARRAAVVLEAVAGPSDLSRRATRRMTLRR